MPLTVQHAKEIMCLAHIYATAGMARVNFSANPVYDYGVDGAFEEIVQREGGQVPSGFQLRYQAKATVDWWIEGDNVVYDLDARAYNNVATRPQASPTLILLLLCLPPEVERWHAMNEDATTIRRCCYWHVFAGEATPNHSQKRIRIPRTNIFTPDTLKGLLALERARQENRWL